MSHGRCECGHSAERHPYLTETFPDACSDCPCERFILAVLTEGAQCPLLGPLDAGPGLGDEMLTPDQFQMRLCESALCRGEHPPCSRCEVLVAHDARLRAEIERLRDRVESISDEAGPEGSASLRQ